MRQGMRTGRRVLAVAVLTLAATVGAVPSEPISHATTGHRASSADTSRQAAVQIAAQTQPTERCQRVVRTIRGKAHEVEECFTVTRITKHSELPSEQDRKKIQRDLMARAQKSRQAAAAADACTLSTANLGIQNVSRTAVCSVAAWKVIKFRKIGELKITVGSIKVLNRQVITTSLGSDYWFHEAQIYVFDGECEWEDGISLRRLDSLCDDSEFCKVLERNHDANTPTFLDNDELHEFQWIEGITSTALSQNGVRALDGELGFRLAPAGVSIWDPDDGVDSGSLRGANGVLTARCDSLFSKSVGCVNQKFVPTMQVKRSKAGASADMIAWAQQNLSGAWGLPGSGSPMHRLTDDAEANANREVLCENSFVRSPILDAALAPYGDRDSCDEFPFAHTYESGANPVDHEGNPRDTVYDGVECAQVEAVQTGTSHDRNNLATDFPVVVPTGSWDGSELCVRGHIPYLLNTSVGGSYSTFLQNVRLIDADAFWLEVVP